MKTGNVWSIVWRVLAVLVAVAGVAFVVIAYGDKIAAWAKRVCGKFCCCQTPTDIVEAEEPLTAEELEETEAPQEEAAVQAEETDFEG